MGYDCWGRSFGRIGSARIRLAGFRVGNGWNPVGSEAPREAPLDGTASLAGAIPMRPGQLQVFFFRCFFFFLGKYQRLGEKSSIFACLGKPFVQYIYYLSMNRWVTTTGISSTEISSSPGCWMQDLDYNGVSAVAWAEKCGRVSGGHKVKNRENCGIEVCEVWYYGICFSFFSPKKMLLKRTTKIPRFRSKRVWSVFLNLALECWCWPMWARLGVVVSVMWPWRFCLECLAFVEKYGILNPTGFWMSWIHF